MNPFFSIIIPAYNAAETLSGTLNSIAKQSCSDYELIVVNDGSTDDTLKILENFKAKNTSLRIKIISQQNQGLGASRNTAIKYATGNYCALLDADDTWHLNKLERCKTILENKPVDLLYHSMDTQVANKTYVRKAKKHKDVNDLLINGSSIIPSASILQTEVAKTYPFSTNKNLHGVEDLDVWVRLLADHKSGKALNESLGYYHEESGMSNKLDEHFNHFKNLLAHLETSKVISPSIKRKALDRKHYEIARFYHKRKLLTQAFTYYAKAWLYVLKKRLKVSS